MTFVCTTCGTTAETPGPLCSPHDSATASTSSAIQDAGARHACRDRADAMRFHCATCGQVAEEKRYLCVPEPVAG